jgi:hypothetical protein
MGTNGLNTISPMDFYSPDSHPVGAASSFIRSRNNKRKGGIKMTRWEYV